MVLAMVDACVNNDRAGVADIMTWFQAEYITDPYYREIFNRLLAVQAGGEPMVAYVVAKGLGDVATSTARRFATSPTWLPTAPTSGHTSGTTLLTSTRNIGGPTPRRTSPVQRTK